MIFKKINKLKINIFFFLIKIHIYLKYENAYYKIHNKFNLFLVL